MVIGGGGGGGVRGGGVKSRLDAYSAVELWNTISGDWAVPKWDFENRPVVANVCSKKEAI